MPETTVSPVSHRLNRCHSSGISASRMDRGNFRELSGGVSSAATSAIPRWPLFVLRSRNGLAGLRDTADTSRDVVTVGGFPRYAMLKRLRIVTALTLTASACGAWLVVLRHDQNEIRGQLSALITEFNGSSAEFSDSTARAARIGQYFTPNVIIEFGKGRSTIQDRETLVGMASRLLPRLSAFAAALADTDIRVLDNSRADVTVTLLTHDRISDSHDFGPCELSLRLLKVEGAWRIRHVELVDVFR